MLLQHGKSGRTRKRYLILTPNKSRELQDIPLKIMYLNNIQIIPGK